MENPEEKKYSSEEMSNIQKERTLSDAELINNGDAEYKFNERGQGGLVLTEDKIKEIRDTQDKETVLKIVKELGQNLQFVSPELQANKEVVLAAVRQDCFALRWASPELQDDEEVVMEAIKSKRWSKEGKASGGLAFEFASPRLRADKEFVKKLFTLDSDSLREASLELRNDKKFIFELTELNPEALYNFSTRVIADDKEILIKFMEKWGGSKFNFASPELKTDKKFVLEVVKKFPSAFKEVSAELQVDEEVKKAAGIE